MTEVFNSVSAWISKDGKDMSSIDKLLKIIIIFFTIKILIKVSYVLIENFFKREQTLKLSMEECKANRV